MPSQVDRRRYGRGREAEDLRILMFKGRASQRVHAHLWPDAYDKLAQDAEEAGLTISGMAHMIIRNHYKLPPIP